jgi:RHS repeat-associated protein
MNTMTKKFNLSLLIGLPAFVLAAGNATAAIGRTQGSFEVSPTGAATYQIPFWVSPGPNGMQPSLTLTYDSQRGTGIVGPGWALTGLSAITRCNHSIAQDSLPRAVDLTGVDKYCIDGKRLRVNSGTYGWAGSTYETEIADFTQIQLPQVNGTDPAYFTAITKSGLTYEYGKTSDSRVTIGSTPTAYMWLVNKVTDRAGNSYKVTYGPGAAGTVGTAVPLSIEYAPSTAGGSSYINTITFVYDAKATLFPDASDKGTRGYVAGNEVVNTNLLLEVKVSSEGSAVRRYVLDYEQAPVTRRPRLANVRECAKASPSDTQLVDCLAPTTIGYQDGENGVTTPGVVVSSTGTAATPLDMDGDGRGDVLYFEGGVFKVARGTPAGSFLAPITVTPAQNGVVGIGDLTTKGFDDIVMRTGNTWTRYTWNGTSFTSTSTGITLPSNVVESGLKDVNGDGRPDGVAVTKTYNASTRAYTNKVYVWLNWSPDKNTLVFAEPVIHQKTLSCGPAVATLSCDATMFIGSGSTTLDFNGDGKIDIAYSTLKPDITAEISKGDLRFLTFNEAGTGFDDIGGFATVFDASEAYGVAGFAHLNDDVCTDVLINSPQNGVSRSPCTGTSGVGSILGAPLGTFDWNSDGRSDLLVQNGSTLGVAISTASGLLPVESIGVSGSNIFVLDFDGDGLQDLGTLSPSGITVYRHASPSKPPDLVTSITDGYGANVTAVYGSILNGNYTMGTEAEYPERDLDTALYVVMSVTQTSGASDGSAAAFSQDYEYFEGRENLAGRGLEGFKRIRITDKRNAPEGNRLVTDIYRHTDFPLTGMVREVDVSLASGAPISKTVNSYAVAPRITYTNNTSFFTYVDWTTTETFEVDPGGSLSGASVRLQKVDPEYDGYGNAVTTETTVTDTFQGSATYGASWTSTVAHTIAPHPDTWCLNVPTRTTITNTAPDVPTITRTTEYSPDPGYVKCRIDAETTEPNTPLQVVTAYQYDGFGNVHQVTVTPAADSGQPARTTVIDWGTTGRYTESITNPLSQATVIEWDRPLGMRTKVTDPNGLMTTFDLDSFGRLTNENRPDQTTTNFALAACTSDNGYCGVAGARSKVAITLKNGGSSIRTDTEYFDVFDRPIRSTQQLFGSAQSEVTRTYDGFGRLATESVPHDPAGTPHNVIYSYDLVGRTTKVLRPEKEDLQDSFIETSFSYAGPTTSTTDALGRPPSQMLRNPLGKIVKSIDAAGNATSYTYDAFGNLTKVVDAATHETVLGYNVRGMKISSQDPDIGNWSYQYYPLGELKNQTDARGKVVEFQYDQLSRMTKRHEEEGDTNWIWGTSATDHNIGRLARVEQKTPGGALTYSEDYTYDDKARLSERDIQSDAAYEYRYEYDPLTGQLGKLTYPAAPGYQLALQYVYENAILREVKDTTTTYWRANEINPLGQVTNESLGNVVTTRRDIDLATGHVSKVLSGIGSATNLQNEAYQYDKVGNLIQRQKYNQVGGNLSEDFHYDALNRLESSLVTTPALGTIENLSVGYDKIGNITKRSDVGNDALWEYDEDHKHGVKQAGPNAYEYDANGNVNKRNGYVIDWTSYNFPSVIRGPNKTLTFSYGPDRQRYRQVYVNGGATETTEYVGGALEKVRINEGDMDWRHYISANGQTVAIVSRKGGVTTTRYLLNDHLGSIAAIFDSNGAPILTESFDAFGARRDGEDWDSDCNCSTLAQMASITRHGFTGHEMIGGKSMGLIHMNGRVMDSVTGRFLSPDPYVQFPFDGQSLNRYSYVRNNPLSVTDPSGFQENDPDVRTPNTDDWFFSCVGMQCWFTVPLWATDYVVRDTRPHIPPSRATPGAIAGPAVLATSGADSDATGYCDFAPTCEEGVKLPPMVFPDPVLPMPVLGPDRRMYYVDPARLAEAIGYIRQSIPRQRALPRSQQKVEHFGRIYTTGQPIEGYPNPNNPDQMCYGGKPAQCGKQTVGGKTADNLPSGTAGVPKPYVTKNGTALYNVHLHPASDANSRKFSQSDMDLKTGRALDMFIGNMNGDIVYFPKDMPDNPSGTGVLLCEGCAK